MSPLQREDGVALLVALLATTLLAALGLALVLATTTESRVAANFRGSHESFYAATAIAELVLDDLLALPDWNLVVSGSAASTFVDGAPTGTRTLSDGTSLDLGGIVNMANCQKTVSCSDADMNAVSPDRPWGPNNPRWRLVAYGRVDSMLPPGAIVSPYYVTLMAAADPSNEPGVLALRAEAFGPGGGHKAIELLVARSAAAPRLLVWHEVR